MAGSVSNGLVSNPGVASQFGNFHRFRAGLDVSALVCEVDANANLWLADTGRQERIAVQRETNAIFLRVADLRRSGGRDSRDVQECRTASEAARFPRVMRFLQEFARTRRAELQRAMIVRLKPHGRVYPHIDTGAYYRRRDRYHLVLVSSIGSEMTSGTERIVAREGELWWFNNKLPHTSANHSPHWRTHVIFDLLPVRLEVRWPIADAGRMAPAAGRRPEVNSARYAAGFHPLTDAFQNRQGESQMSDQHPTNGNPTPPPDNGNGTPNDGHGGVAKDNGNGLVTNRSGGLDHHYSFAISDGSFSLSIVLDFKKGKSEPKDNGNGDPLGHGHSNGHGDGDKGDNGNGSGA